MEFADAALSMPFVPHGTRQITTDYNDYVKFCFVAIMFISDSFNVMSYKLAQIFIALIPHHWTQCVIDIPRLGCRNL